MNVVLKQRDGSEYLAPPDLTWDVERYSHGAVGGPDEAKVTAYGPKYGLWQLADLLRYELVIEDDEGTEVWWGWIDTIVIRVGALEVTITIDNLWNKARVLFTYVDPGSSGIGQQRDTGWATNTASAAEYGTRAITISSADESDDSAEAKRDRKLAECGDPIAIPTVAPGRSAMSASIKAKGWWHTLEWDVYTQDAGLEQHTAGSVSHIFAWGYQGTVGFDGDENAVHDFSGDLQYIPSQVDRVQVENSSSNDGLHVVTSKSISDPPTALPSSAQFTDATAPDKDYVEFAGADVFSANQAISVSGTVSNNGYYLIESVSDQGGGITRLTIKEEWGAFSDETVSDPGFVAGRKLVIDGSSIVSEAPGTCDLFYPGIQVLQTFQLGSSTTWYPAKVWLKIGKVGTPGTVTALIRKTSASGPIIASGTLAVSDIPQTTPAWREVGLVATEQITSGTTYWLQVYVGSGDYDPDDYYLLAVDEGLGYTRGKLWVWDGSSWGSRTPPADLAFKVTGEWETTYQIEQMLADSQFLDAYEIQDDSGIYSNQYRDGTQRHRTLIEDLMAAGTTNGRRLLATVNSDRRVTIREEPAEPDDPEYLIGEDGQLRHYLSGEVQSRLCPVGVWCEIDLDGVVAALNTFLIEAVEYNPDRDGVSLTPKETDPLWKLGGVANR